MLDNEEVTTAMDSRSISTVKKMRGARQFFRGKRRGIFQRKTRLAATLVGRASGGATSPSWSRVEGGRDDRVGVGQTIELHESDDRREDLRGARSPGRIWGKTPSENETDDLLEKGRGKSVHGN